jgi:carboxypeptidase family protein
MPRVLLALLVVAGVSAGVVWLVTKGEGRRGRGAPPVAAVEPGAQPATTKEPAPLAPPPAAPAPVPVASAPAREPAPAAREAMPSLPAEELASAQWIEGRVVLPPGTPADEELFVTADGRDFEGKRDHRVRVEPDGSFRVAFSEKTRSGRIELDARYLYLEEPFRWKRGEASGPLVLEPRLGGRIVGRLRPPPGAGGGDVGGRIELFRTSRSASESSSEQLASRPLVPAPEPEFAFDGLAPSREGPEGYELGYDGERFLARNLPVVLEPGQTRTVELELKPGVTLAGVVRDERGAPLADVQLNATVTYDGGTWSSAHHRNGKSAADGTFRLGALAVGEVQLRAEIANFQPLTKDLGELAAGTDVTDVELVFTRGQSISGHVRWPDGSPAEAMLTLVPRSSQPYWKDRVQESEGKSDADGAFAIGGLTAEAYRVTAKATKTEEVSETSEITGRERKKKQRRQWNAELDSVALGTSDLVLTLTSGLELAGTVTDERGTPLDAFFLTARRVEGLSRSGMDSPRRGFRDAGGQFVMTGLAPGSWELSGQSSGHADGSVRVTLPSSEPVVLVLPRGASLSGRVLDPAGAPVADADVALDTEGSFSSMHFSLGEDDETDADGFFALEDVSPGSTTLQASAPGFAPSAPLALEVVAGESTTGLVLTLRPGARILGELVGSDGRPEVERTVRANSDGFHGSAETDAEGRFEIADVPPGEHRLWADTSEGIQIQQSVSVAEGETVRVRLAPPGGLVRLHGVVRAGGAPLAKANLYASRRGEDGRSTSTSSSAETDDEGAYELGLAGAGKYWLHVNGAEESSFSWRASVEVPEVQSFAFDVAIPLGRISGRVTDTSGQALSAQLVRSEPELHEGGAHGSSQVLTDADGRYELLVPAGRHAVTAGGSLKWWSPEPATAWSEARVAGLVVAENGHLRGIDLRLEAGGTLAGTVKNADGTGAAFAMLWADDGGRGKELGWCDDTGRFELAGVAAGRHRIGARGQAGTTRELVTVEIAVGQTSRLELVLLPARLVHLSVRQASQPVGSEIECFDERSERQTVNTGENGEAWLGPLVPGTYTVRAERDGKRAERAFEVTSGTEAMELTLVFE